MADKFDAPRLAINRVYTRQGDDGGTALAGGQRVSKNDIRIECYGTVDELNSFVGLARGSALEHPELPELVDILLRIQHELFNLGSILATLPGDVHPNQARITVAEATQLEEEMDRMNADLSPLRSFVLPGPSRINGELHVCRTICRRAERLCVTLFAGSGDGSEILIYLNRLSDAFFVWSRWASHRLNYEETLWRPNEAASKRYDKGNSNAESK